MEETPFITKEFILSRKNIEELYDYSVEARLGNKTYPLSSFREWLKEVEDLPKVTSEIWLEADDGWVEPLEGIEIGHHEKVIYLYTNPCAGTVGDEDEDGDGNGEADQ